MVRYDSIVIEGFQSICTPLKFKLDRGAGINLLKAKNGVGKTTIFNALLWAEYGKNMKSSVATWADKRTDSFRGTRVIVKRRVGEYDFLIARHEDFKGTTRGIEGKSSILIFKKHKDEEGRDFTKDDLQADKYKGDNQRSITDQLAVTHSVFLNSIIFGQKMKKIIEADGKDKRGLFEEIFELSFVENAKEKAKELISEAEQKVNEINLELVQLNAKIESNVKAKDDYVARKEKHDESLNTRTLQLEDNIQAKQEEIDTTKEELVVLDKELAGIGKKLDSIRDGLKEYDELQEKLVTARQELSVEQDKRHEISAQIRSLTTEIENKLIDFRDDILQDKKNQIRDEKEKSYELSSELSQRERDVKSKQQAIESSKSRLAQKEEELACVSDTCPTCSQKLKDGNKEVKEAIKDQIKQEKELVTTLEKELVTCASLVKTSKIKVAESAQLLEQLNGDLLNLEGTMEINVARERATLTDASNYKELQDTLKELLGVIIPSKETAIENIKDSMNEFSSLLQNKQEVEQDREAKSKLKSTKEATISGCNSAIEAYSDELNRLKEDNTYLDFEQRLTSYDEENKDCEELIKDWQLKLTEKEKRITHLNWWVKKGYGASGVRAYVFEYMLKKLNALCLSYYDSLGFYVDFSIDMTKASKPFITKIHSGGEIRDYQDLSGGQKQRVDICVAFALHDLVCSTQSFNVLILDEIFEGLDTEGLEVAFELIRKKADMGLSVYLVTHNDIIDSLYCKTIELGVNEYGSTIVKSE